MDDPAAWVRTVAWRVAVSQHRRASVAARLLPRLRGKTSTTMPAVDEVAVIYPPATLARRGDVMHAHATLPGVNGHWIRIEAAPLEGDRDGDIAVTIRAASPGETFDLACRVHGLTPRETEVMTGLVAGVGTREVARALHVSDWTVQDHLKSVFTKLDVHSRRESLARRAGT